ncbi:MAG: MFS transporter [Actinomycetota bacterium]|nr:MFS transporter [Actinomycetota bacterium]
MSAPGRAVVPAAGGAKWAILAVTTLGAFIANVDATIVVVGLPRILEGLHASITTGLWTMTGYLLVSTVLLLPVGRFSDLFGRKRIYLVGFLVFALGSALCALAPSGGWLVGFRFLQGVGGAILASVATPIITEAFPSEELGRALGINSVAWVLGSVVGPVVGGALVSAFGWRSIFWVTVPFALAGALVGAAVLPSRARAAGRQPMDWVGAASFTVALTALLVALSEGLAWGWASARILGLFALAAAALVAFFVTETRRARPLFALGLFRHRHFAAAQGVVVSASIAFFATTFLLTFYLQGAIHETPLVTGLLLIPLSGPQMLTGPLGGRLADRLGYPGPIIGGLVVLGVGAFLLSLLGPSLALAGLVVPLALISVGNGFYWPALVKATMQSAPAQVAGAAAGMFYTLRNVGFTLSLTLALLSAETSLPPAVATRVFLGVGGVLSASSARALVHSVDVAFLLFVACYALALVVSLGLLRRVPAATGTATDGPPLDSRGA